MHEDRLGSPGGAQALGVQRLASSVHLEPESQPLGPKPDVNAPPRSRPFCRLLSQAPEGRPHRTSAAHTHPAATTCTYLLPPRERRAAPGYEWRGRRPPTRVQTPCCLRALGTGQTMAVGGVPDIPAHLLPRRRGSHIRTRLTGMGLDKCGLGGGPEGLAECCHQWTWAEADAGCPHPSSPLAGVSPRLRDRSGTFISG